MVHILTQVNGKIPVLGPLNPCRYVNGNNFPAEGDDTNGIEQLLDLVHILVLALNQNAIWAENLPSRGETSFG